MWKLYVGNLSSRIREMELANEFRAYGLVRSVWIARNPPGYAFVEFDSRQEAYDAIAALDGLVAPIAAFSIAALSIINVHLPSSCTTAGYLLYRSQPLLLIGLCPVEPLISDTISGCVHLYLPFPLRRLSPLPLSDIPIFSTNDLMFLGKHGWRVEMSRKSSGGMRRRSPSRDSRCQECGSHHHHTRNCQSRASRSSSRRSSSPHSRTLMSRDSPQRRLTRSRFPLHNDRYNESSPRNHEKSFPEKIECIRSPQNAQNGSPSAGSAQGHEDGPSRKSGSSKSPQNDLNSPQTDGQHSPKEPEYSSSPRSGCSRSPDDVQIGFQRDGPELSEHDHSGTLEHMNGGNNPSLST